MDDESLWCSLCDYEAEDGLSDLQDHVESCHPEFGDPDDDNTPTLEVRSSGVPSGRVGLRLVGEFASFFALLNPTVLGVPWRLDGDEAHAQITDRADLQGQLDRAGFFVVDASGYRPPGSESM